MEFTFNKIKFNLTPTELVNLKPKFTLLRGRRFSFQSKNGAGFEELSLNNLILLVNKTALEQKHDVQDLKGFFSAFKVLRDKGYVDSDHQLNKENFLIRIITKIKHFFSKMQTDDLLKKFATIVVKIYDEEKNHTEKAIAPDSPKIHEAVKRNEPEKAVAPEIPKIDEEVKRDQPKKVTTSVIPEFHEEEVREENKGDPTKVAIPIPEREAINDSIENSCKELLNKLQYFPKATNKELVSIFEELESQNPEVSKKADNTLKFLLNHDIDPYKLMLHSFPLWPVVNKAALQKIAKEQSESNNPIIRKRAKSACLYLVTLEEEEEGFAIAALQASKKLKDPDEKIQIEGLEYFEMLLKRCQPILVEEDLLNAIKVASRWLMDMDTEKMDTEKIGQKFFNALIKYGRPEDILKAKQYILDACSSSSLYKYAYTFCSLIITQRNDEKLLSIPLQAALDGASSRILKKRMLVFFILRDLLYFFPENSIETVKKIILMESQQNNPTDEILRRLQELSGQDFTNQSVRCQKFVENKLQENSGFLIEALTNLSNCADLYNIRMEASKIKEKLELQLHG